MNLCFETALADKYPSQPQKIRVMTEHWVNSQIYCPNCGYLKIEKYGNNKPVADFFCPNCDEDYELKSTQKLRAPKIADGAYESMIKRLLETKNPNLFLLNYNFRTYQVQNFLVIPKQFFVPALIEKKKASLPSGYTRWLGRLQYFIRWHS
jgi:type II restriction enzyme